MTNPSPTWRIGETLPWAAPWSGEAVFDLAPSPQFPGLLDLVQREAPGEGEAQLTGMNLMRQRRGVVQFLCHVCGRPTPPDDRFLFPVVTGTFLKARGRTHYVSHMPPTHGACAARAQRLCPHLRAALAQPVAFPRDVGVLAPETGLPDSLAYLTDRLPAKGVAYSYFRVFGEGFTRVVRRLRAEGKS